MILAILSFVATSDPVEFTAKRTSKAATEPDYSAPTEFKANVSLYIQRIVDV